MSLGVSVEVCERRRQLATLSTAVDEQRLCHDELTSSEESSWYDVRDRAVRWLSPHPGIDTGRPPAV